MKIEIEIQMPKPGGQAREGLTEKVDRVIDQLNSNDDFEDKEYGWHYLQCLYRKLCECKGRLTPEASEVKDKLSKFFAEKSGTSSGSKHVDVTGVDLARAYRPDWEK